MRALAKASPRVKVYSIGNHGGRARDDRGRCRIGGTDRELDENRPSSRSSLIHARSTWTTRSAEQIAADAAGLLHHGHDPLAGSRRADGAHGARVSLAVDESAYIKNIRDNLITLITPIVEVDGRDRVVDSSTGT
jgi:hypothetical protein